jgi:hypothetical protein
MSNKKSLVTLTVVTTLAVLAVLLIVGVVGRYSSSKQVMLILRGIAAPTNPRGQLDDASALEYARRLGFRGEVLDVAGRTGPDSPQVKMALERIHRDSNIGAIYGFSGGGYNVPLIWKQLTPDERSNLRKVVIVGSPGIAKSDFPGSTDVVIKQDPAAGHMAGPRVLLESLGPQLSTEK